MADPKDPTRDPKQNQGHKVRDLHEQQQAKQQQASDPRRGQHNQGQPGNSRQAGDMSNQQDRNRQSE